MNLTKKKISMGNRNDDIFDSMLMQINYSNYLEAIVNGVIVAPLETKEQGNGNNSMKRKYSNKMEQSTDQIKGEIFIDKSTQSELIKDKSEGKSSFQTSTKSVSITKSNKHGNIKKHVESLRVKLSKNG